LKKERQNKDREKTEKIQRKDREKTEKERERGGRERKWPETANLVLLIAGPHLDLTTLCGASTHRVDVPSCGREEDNY